MKCSQFIKYVESQGCVTYFYYPVVGKVGPMTMALQLRRAERAGGGCSSSMVLQHVEEDETNATKDKADKR